MATRFEALEKLRQKFMEKHHDYRSATSLFLSLDVEKIAKDMELGELGEERGSENQPPKSARTFDDVENSIVERVEDEMRAAHQKLEDELNLYSRRIAGLAFDEQFGMLQQVNSSSLSDFKAEISIGLDELHAKRTDLKEATDELVDFRKDHNLKRVARLSGGPAHLFKVSLLVFLFIIESYMNGSFLAKGSDQGLIGGVTEALAFSFINIGAALILAIFCVRLVVHRSLMAKLLGVCSIVVYMAIAVGINLLLAHYREVSGTVFEGAGVDAIANMWANPLGLTDIRSWMLFLVGLLFSLIAFIDGCFVFDPYPGYAGVEKRRRARREDYTDTKAELIDKLQGVRDEHNEAVEEIIKGLGSRRREHAAILTSRDRVLALFTEHQEQLERACNQLLSKYREANIQARTTPPPRHFSQKYKLQKSKAIVRSEGEIKDSELAAQISRAQDVLNEQMIQIGKVCEDGIEQYRDLDKLYPENVDG